MRFYSHRFGVLQFREGNWYGHDRTFQTNPTNIFPVCVRKSAHIHGEIKVEITTYDPKGVAIISFVTSSDALGNGDPGVISSPNNMAAFISSSLYEPEDEWFRQLEECIWYALNEGDVRGKIPFEETNPPIWYKWAIC